MADPQFARQHVRHHDVFRRHAGRIRQGHAPGHPIAKESRTRLHRLREFEPGAAFFTRPFPARVHDDRARVHITQHRFIVDLLHTIRHINPVDHHQPVSCTRDCRGGRAWIREDYTLKENTVAQCIVFAAVHHQRAG